MLSISQEKTDCPDQTVEQFDLINPPSEITDVIRRVRFGNQSLEYALQHYGVTEDDVRFYMEVNDRIHSQNSDYALLA